MDMIPETDFSALSRTQLRALLRKTFAESNDPLELCVELLKKSAETRSEPLQSATLRSYLGWMRKSSRNQSSRGLPRCARHGSNCVFDLFMAKFSDVPYKKPTSGMIRRWNHMHQIVEIFDNFGLLQRFFISYVKGLMLENDYVSAGFFIAHCSLQPFFTSSLFSDVIQPLYLQQGKSVQILEALLDRQPALQQQLESWIRECALKSESELRQIVQQKVKFRKGKSKRRAFALLQNPNLPESAELLAIDAEAQNDALPTLIHIWSMWKGFGKRSLNDIQYTEHIEYALEDPNLQSAFVKFLHKKGESSEAARWESFDPRKAAERRITDAPQRYNLDGYTVEYVEADSVAEIENLINTLRGIREDVIAFDFENRPFYKCGVEKVALMQIAFGKHVKIVNLLHVERFELRKCFERLFKELFFSSNIKIGFGISGDLSALISSFPPFENIKTNNVVDMRSLASRLKNKPIDPGFQSLLIELSDNGDSLAKLSKRCLGVELDKSEQLSNFDLRPLRRSQMDYAARDVIVLLEVYEAFRKLKIRTLTFDRYMQQIKNSNIWQKKAAKKKSR